MPVLSAHHSLFEAFLFTQHSIWHQKLYTSIIRVEDIRNEDGNRVIDAVIINWDPHQVVAIPISLLPASLQEKLNQDTRLLAKVNVGASKAEDLIFEDFKLAPEPKPYDPP